MMQDKEDSWLTDGNYQDEEYALRHTFVPQDPANIPQIIGVSGPARSGTTALMFAMASQPWVDRAYFQPQKSLLRNGQPDFVIRPDDKLIFTKEVFGLLHDQENFDPIGHLLKSGVPAEKITWITLLRDPRHTYASWLNLTSKTTVQTFARAQDHAINIYEKYKDVVESVPMVYEMFDKDLDSAMASMFSKTRYADKSFFQGFDEKAISAKVELGQAKNPSYFQKTVSPVLLKHKFIFTRLLRPIDRTEANRVEDICGAQYVEFRQHCENVLKSSD